uniref:Uncharacterized protein n=1 Tax=Glossina brevipalpis TaxID=37001 RepID=A0A1A9WWM9_9MUSC
MHHHEHHHLQTKGHSFPKSSNAIGIVENFRKFLYLFEIAGYTLDSLGSTHSSPYAYIAHMLCSVLSAQVPICIIMVRLHDINHYICHEVCEVCKQSPLVYRLITKHRYAYAYMTFTINAIKY